MKLTVCMRPGGIGTVALLCDERGNPLPNQIETRVVSVLDDLSRISVDFIIDGDKIRMIDSEKA